MKKELQLSSLRQILAGYLLELIALLFTGQAATALMNGSSVTAIVLGALCLLAMLLLFVGVSGLRNASPYFEKAKKPLIIRMGIAIVTIVSFVFLHGRGQWTSSDVGRIGRQTALEVTILLLVLAAVWILAALATTRSILRGCGHVAEQVDDPVFSLRCMRLWRFWSLGLLLFVMVILVAIAVLLNVYRKTLESGVTGTELQETLMINMASGALLSGIIMLVGGAIFLIVHILYLLRIHKTFREYHLELVTVSEESGRPIEYEGLQQYALPEEEPVIGVETEEES